MQESTTDLLRQMIALQQQAIANQQASIEVQMRAVRRQRSMAFVWYIIVVLVTAFILYDYWKFHS